ncbi:MAG: alkaline phytoceramidase [Pseudomonadota bacterium]
MKRLLVHLPLLVTVTLGALLAAHGPIAQLPRYHEFADRSVLMGLPHAADVLSNIGFGLVALWGLARLWPMQGPGRDGYRLFLVGLLLTAAGSALYHLAPDDARLVWDRIPIALACAGLLAAVRAECLAKAGSLAASVLLGIVAVLSVAWWYVTERSGAGDLRPYLLIQCLPLLLIPMWQFIHGAPRRDKVAFGIALALYVLAKWAELNDHALLDALGVVSGHTIKHLLATAAAAVLVARLIERERAADREADPKSWCQV